MKFKTAAWVRAPIFSLYISLCVWEVDRLIGTDPAQRFVITHPFTPALESTMELSEEEKLSEAEQYHLKALFILHELQANKQVYGSNSALTGATPANVDLALQYIDRSVELFPENPVYLNLKALLLWEGKGDKANALALLEKAAALNPRDIDIQNNLNALKTSQCVVATAAFGSPLAAEVNALRRWRDERLMSSRGGQVLVAVYYALSPSVAVFVSRYRLARHFIRIVLRAVIHRIKLR